MIDVLLFGLLGRLFTTVTGRILLRSILAGVAIAVIVAFVLGPTDVSEDMFIVAILAAFLVVTILVRFLERKRVFAKLRVTDEQHRQLLIGGFIPTSNGERNDMFRLIKFSRGNVKELLSQYWGIGNQNQALETITMLTSAQNHTSFADDVYHNIIKKGVLTPTPADFATLKPENAEDEKRIRKCIATYGKAIKMLAKAGITEADIAGITTLAAWDYGRVAFIGRYSVHAKFMTEETAWPFIRQAAENAAATYDNWKQYIAAYVIGRAIAYDDVLYVSSGKLGPKSDFAKVPFR